MKQHLASVEGDIGPSKSIPPNARFWMENSLHEFMKFKKVARLAYKYEHPYGPNIS